MAAGLAAAPASARAKPGPATDFGGEALRQAVRAAEADAGGRLGVAVLDTAGGARFAWRGDERFAMCSTFKLLMVAAVLARVEAGHERLDRRIVLTRVDPTGFAPVTETRVGPPGMTIGELCEAAIIWSDNGAANVLFPTVGGPPGLTRYARALGDPATRMDRTEPTLNDAVRGDPRDTTTPKAMLADLNRLVLGDGLASASRQRLTGWMTDCRTGVHRLRAGLPPGWRIGHKTGTGDHGSTNDIAILWPPGRAPLLVTAYLTDTQAPTDRCEAALAAVARAVAAAV
jgi:beta-lactamase class A